MIWLRSFIGKVVGVVALALASALMLAFLSMLAFGVYVCLVYLFLILQGVFQVTLQPILQGTLNLVCA
jgi:hypothetical protein